MSWTSVGWKVSHTDEVLNYTAVCLLYRMHLYKLIWLATVQCCDLEIFNYKTIFSCRFFAESGYFWLGDCVLYHRFHHPFGWILKLYLPLKVINIEMIRFIATISVEGWTRNPKNGARRNNIMFYQGLWNSDKSDFVPRLVDIYLYGVEYMYALYIYLDNVIEKKEQHTSVCNCIVVLIKVVQSDIKIFRTCVIH